MPTATAAADAAPAGRRRQPGFELAVQYRTGRAGLPAAATLRRWAAAALARDANLTLRFVGQAEGRRLNAAFRRKDYATNVLTFVYDGVADRRQRARRATPLAGDIVLCVPVMRREARAARRPLAAHCAHLVVHGMLHLQGYDHENEDDTERMEARERAVLARLGFPDPYGARDA
jgi:probable rRNA maturation factor